LRDLTDVRTLSERIDDPARRFWSLCQGAESPDARAFLESESPLDSSMRVAILRIDQTERWIRGEHVSAERYLGDFPELRDNPEYALELIYSEFLLSHEFGESPDIDEFAARYPDHADRLRTQVELHQALLEVDDPTRGGEPARRPQIPGYEILGVLGRGGMGIVYHARQTRLNRPVALKMILAGEYARPEQTSRFLTEANAIARLQHPHIVAIHDVGEDLGHLFLALEYVEGGSLFEHLLGNARPAREAARLVETLAHAIHAAHQKGIIHRDLKPANILMTKEGEPKIADFGLAKLLGDDSGLTRSGSILGSPYYMAPEQVGTRANQVGPTADIYSLGAILYELLTGVAPFRGGSALETLQLAKTTEPEPPSRIRAGLPRELDTICLKCLEKNPPHRYESAEALAEDLRRFRADEPILARRSKTWERGLRWARKNPALAGTASFALVLLLCTFAGVAREWRRAEADLRHEVSINQQLKQANERERTARRRAQTRFAVAIDTVKAYSKDASQSMLQDGGSNNSTRSYRLATALALFRKLKEQAQDDIDSDQDAELARAFADIGSLMWDIGATSDAEVAYREAFSIRQSILERSPRDASLRAEIAALLANLSNINRVLQRTDEALKLQVQALSRWRDLVRENPKNIDYLRALSWAHGNVGAIHSLLGHPRESLDSHNRARDIRLAILQLSPGNVAIRGDLAWTELDISNYHRVWGRLEDALGPAGDAVTILREIAATHPRNQDNRVRFARSLNNLGVVYRGLSRRSDAIQTLKEALRQWEPLCEESPAVQNFRRERADALDCLGAVELQRYRFDDSREAFEQAVALRDDLFGEHPSDLDLGDQLAASMEQLGRVFLLLNRPEQAVARFESATEIYERILRYPSPSSTRYRARMIECERALATARIAGRQWDEGLDGLRRARSQLCETLAKTGAAGALRQVAEIDNEMGLALERRGQSAASLGKYATVYRSCAILWVQYRATEDARSLLNAHLSSRGYVLRDQGRNRKAAAMALIRRGLWPSDPNEVYNAACELSLCSARAAARDPDSLEWAIESRLARGLLVRAIQLGFADFELIRIDPDLAAIRSHSEFDALLGDAIFPRNAFVAKP
jgi:eukaryotic-like serine/threonine-protein kinase